MFKRLMTKGAAPMLVLSAAVPLIAAAQTFENLLTEESLLGIICAVRDGLFPIFMTLGVIAFIVAGALYLTAAGDPGKMGRAKKATMYGAIGVAAAIISLGAAFIIAEIFGVSAAEVC